MSVTDNDPATATYTVADGSPALEAHAAVTLTPADPVTSSAATIAATNPTISVKPNHPPRFLGNFERIRSIAERVPVGTNVGDPIVATDPDSDTLRYTLDDGADARYFTITDTGQVQTQQILDYENPADKDQNDTYAVTVRATDSYGVSAITDVTITVTDVDVDITISETTPNTIDENGAAGTYTVVLNSQPTGDVTITLASSDISVATVSDPLTLTFDTANWDTPQSVEVTGVPDGRVIDTRTATITHSVSGGDYTGVSVDAVVVSVTNVDRDTTGGDGNGGGGGRREAARPDLVGFLENPGPNSFQSGIGVLSGWACEAELVEFVIETAQGETERHVAAYGTERLDTAEVCDDVDNGFGLLFNWNRMGDGEHTVTAFVDGEELAQATVTVPTLGAEFLRGRWGSVWSRTFLRMGRWSR